MNKQKMIQTINKMKFKTVKNAPQILMLTGTFGVIGSTVLACKATLKLSAVLDKTKTTIDTVHTTVTDKDIEYTKEDAKRDLTIIYASTAMDIAKLYLPAIIVGGLSIGGMIKSHNILSRRNAALAAAFTTASESFARYRKAVVDKYGERVDHELRHGIKAEKISVTDDKGKTKKETADVINNPLDLYSDYARMYDDGCEGWSKDPEYNLMFLRAQQQYANDKLIAQGFLFLNDVYDMLGIPKSKAGQVVGWTYNPDNPSGDNYVDFGIYDVNKPQNADFVNGYERTILLDFNVDGNVWEQM